MGKLVKSPIKGKDEFGTECGFLSFPNLSCPIPGKYRLKFTLMKIDPTKPSPAGQTLILAETFSDTFTIYKEEDFPGNPAENAFSSTLRAKGYRLPLEKEEETEA